MQGHKNVRLKLREVHRSYENVVCIYSMSTVRVCIVLYVRTYVVQYVFSAYTVPVDCVERTV